MPVTRAASNNSIAHGGPGPSSNKKRKAPAKPPAEEIIVISDSDTEMEDIKPAIHNPKPSKKRTISQTNASSGSSKRARMSTATDFSGIEVVEPPEDPPEVKEWKNRAQAAEHARRVSEKSAEERIRRHKSAEASAKAESDVLRKELKESRDKEKQLVAKAEIAEKALAKAATSGSGDGIDLEALEEAVSCEICQEKMWQPWMLSECGHVYCQKCLTDWFGTTHAKHLETHPGYDVNYAPVMTPAQLTHLPMQLQPYFAHHVNGLPRPPYSCPTCRAEITRKPSEAYVVKTIVQLIADKTGEKNPHPPPQAPYTPSRRSRGKGKAKAPVVPSGPWDGFFGRA